MFPMSLGLLRVRTAIAFVNCHAVTLGPLFCWNIFKIFSWSGLTAALVVHNDQIGHSLCRKLTDANYFTRDIRCIVWVQGVFCIPTHVIIMNVQCNILPFIDEDVIVLNWAYALPDYDWRLCNQKSKSQICVLMKNCASSNLASVWGIRIIDGLSELWDFFYEIIHLSAF